MSFQPDSPDFTTGGAVGGIPTAETISLASTMPELATGTDASMASLTSSFKDMMKKEKKQKDLNDQIVDAKRVTVEIEGKKKRTGGTNSKKSVVTTNLVRFF